MSEDGSFLVTTVDVSTVQTRGARRISATKLDVDVLAENVNVFLADVEKMLAKAPEDVGKFKLTEFTVSAEVSAKASLVLLGTGVEAGGSGGLTFKFERKP